MRPNKTFKPFCVVAGDYHDFQFIANAMKQGFHSVKYKEIGCDGNYHAVFYSNKIDDGVKKMIKKQRIAINENNSYEQ